LLIGEKRQAHILVEILFRSVGNSKSRLRKYLEKALAISMEILGDGEGEATWYGKLGRVFQSLGEYIRAKETYVKALSSSIEIGDRKMRSDLLCKNRNSVSLPRLS